MKSYILLTISCMLITQATWGQALPEKPEDDYDFWVGKWKVSWEEAQGKLGSGTNHITKILDQTVIQEHFEILEGQSKGFKGTSISVYNPNSQQWKQAWADNQGAYYDFTGKKDGDRRIFQTAVVEQADGKRFTQRMVFYDIQEDSLTWDWESSSDGGKNWKLNWRIHYERMKE